MVASPRGPRNGFTISSGITVLILATTLLVFPSGCGKLKEVTGKAQPDPTPEPTTQSGTLELQFADDPPEKCELLVDGRAHTLKVTDGKMTLSLRPGSYTIAFKVNA